MPRYAVLLDLEDADLRPIALVTEHEDEVLVHFAVDCGLKSKYREPYQVIEPDGESVRFAPGRDEYFNSVINTLARGFAVKEIESRESLEPQDIAELYFQKIILPRTLKQTTYSKVTASAEGLVQWTSAGSFTTTAYSPFEHAELPDEDETQHDSLLTRAA